MQINKEGYENILISKYDFIIMPHFLITKTINTISSI